MKKFIGIIFLTFFIFENAFSNPNKILEKTQDFVVVGMEIDEKKREFNATKKMFRSAKDICHSMNKLSYHFYQKWESKTKKIYPLPDFSIKYDDNYNSFRFICSNNLNDALNIFFRGKNFSSLIDKPDQYLVSEISSNKIGDSPKFITKLDYENLEEKNDNNIVAKKDIYYCRGGKNGTSSSSIFLSKKPCGNDYYSIDIENYIFSYLFTDGKVNKITKGTLSNKFHSLFAEFQVKKLDTEIIYDTIKNRTELANYKSLIPKSKLKANQKKIVKKINKKIIDKPKNKLIVQNNNLEENIKIKNKETNSILEDRKKLITDSINQENQNNLTIFNDDFSKLKKRWDEFEINYKKNNELAQIKYSSIDKDHQKLNNLSKKLEKSISIVFDLKKFNSLKNEFTKLENKNLSLNKDLMPINIDEINKNVLSVNSKITSINNFIDQNITKSILEIDTISENIKKEKIKNIILTIGILVLCLVVIIIVYLNLKKIDFSNLKNYTSNLKILPNTQNLDIIILFKDFIQRLVKINSKSKTLVITLSIIICILFLKNFTDINLNPFAKDEYVNIDFNSLSKDEKKAYTCIKTYGFKKGSDQFRRCIVDINKQEIEKQKIEVEKTIMQEKLARTKVEEAELELSKKYDNIDPDSLSDDEKKAYTCVKTFGFKVGSETFQKCVNKMTEGELELRRIEIEKKVAEAQLLTAKANKEAAYAKAEAARAQGEIQKAQVEAARAAAEASKQAAAAAEARAKADDFNSAMSLIEMGLNGLQPQQPSVSHNTLSLQTRCFLIGNIMKCR